MSSPHDVFNFSGECDQLALVLTRDANGKFSVHAEMRQDGTVVDTLKTAEDRSLPFAIEAMRDSVFELEGIVKRARVKMEPKSSKR